MSFPEDTVDTFSPALHGLSAVVFDTDGVITDSARLHAAAWKTTFDVHLREHPPAETAQRRPFDVGSDYLLYVDGKSRHDGAAAFLRSRGLPADPWTVSALAAKKDRCYSERLRHGPPAPAYPGTLALLRMLRRSGVATAAVSASRHAAEVLTRAGVLPLFDTLVDGVEAARLGLPGKPAPGLFVEAARRLNVEPHRCAVVEDALSGVEAGRRGGFGLVIGVDRHQRTGHRNALLRYGADLVVDDLGELLAQGAVR